MQLRACAREPGRAPCNSMMTRVRASKASLINHQIFSSKNLHHGPCSCGPAELAGGSCRPGPFVACDEAQAVDGSLINKQHTSELVGVGGSPKPSSDAPSTASSCICLVDMGEEPSIHLHERCACVFRLQRKSRERGKG